MKNIRIRGLHREDNADIAKIIKQVLAEFGANKPGTVFFDPTTDDLCELFAKPASAYFIAEDETGILGGSGLFPTPGLPAGYCELVKLYLLPEARGLGLGLQLMKTCFEQARAYGYTKMYLETMPELRTAIGLYEKAGFAYLEGPLGQSGHFGCDLWMTKNL